MSGTPETPLKTPRTKLRRMPAGGSHELTAVEAILDEALVCHIGLLDGGAPLVVPTLHARAGSNLYLHGSAASRALRQSDGAEICLTATLVDGIVLARAAVHHSANYRSAMVFGRAELVGDGAEKAGALEALVEKIVPGRWADARRPTERELRATAVLRLPLEEASAKIRSGPPLDDEEDMGLPVWAGVLPMRTVHGPLQPDAALAEAIRPPDYLDELLSA